MSIQWFLVFESIEKAKTLILEGKSVTIDIGEKQVCLFRKGEKFIATSSVCPHQGAPMSRAWCDEEDGIVCPYHRYRYHAENGRDLSSGGDPLKIYPVEIRKTGIYIGIESKKAWWKMF